MMHKRKIFHIRNLALLLVIILIASVLTSCNDYFDAIGDIAGSPVLASRRPLPSQSSTLSPSPKASETPKPEPSIEPEPEPEPETDPWIVSALNPLTGIQENMYEFATYTRPVCVILENKWASLPQLGLADADIVIEMLVEYDIARFMAIYKDPYEVEKVGAVRSLRSYFTKMALAFEGLIFHYGFSEDTEENAKQDLLDRNLETVNGLYDGDKGHPYWRDAYRLQNGYELMHTVVTAGPNILEAVASLDMQKTTLENQKAVFNFSDTPSTEDASKALAVYLRDAYVNSPYFLYDDENGKYIRGQYGDVHTDGNRGQILEFDNVFVLKMDTTYLHDYAKHVAITTFGKGTGYYFNGGKYVQIEWSRQSDSSQFVFMYDTKELEVSPGNTWISCIDSNKDVTVE